MNSGKLIWGVAGGLILLGGFFLAIYFKIVPESSSAFPKAVTIQKTWKLPKKLREISGIAYLDHDKIACIQDEKGIIFIYNLKTAEIEKQIPFGKPGDYEGIALKGSTAFVLRSDGVVFQVKNYNSDPKVQIWKTWISKKQDVEGLYYDLEKDQLLLAVKDEGSRHKEYKGIYVFNLKQQQLEKVPLFTIEMKDSVFEKIKSKKLKNTFKPSEINRDPKTRNYFILDGHNPKLLILDPAGIPKKTYSLPKSDFPQPEGITFGGKGEIYISNEGNPATIHQISIN